MPRRRSEAVATLAGYWSAPATPPAGDVGRPLVCVASTYTFHASFLESELLPRFLGLKFDETEGVRPFVVEREERLATARVCVLVDADHHDPSQSTLRWDQLPVRVPGGAQHSKVVVLIWENYARLIVSSANLTRPGYRRNREIAGAVDFYDHEGSAPRRLVLDAIAFLQNVSEWVRASAKAKARLSEALEEARRRVRSWRNMPAGFTPLERPRVTFVAGLPREKGGVAWSPLEQLIELWGTRRASEITVMTPFVGDLAGTADPVVEKLLELPRTRDATGYLVVPGRPSEEDAKRMVAGLPRRFAEAWASAWCVDPGEVPAYIVPLCRADEKTNRDLHAKGILLGDDGVAMLLCGSSNFSPHGMGVGVANVEANLCYLDDPDTKRNGMRLKDRLPVDWDKDFCERPNWPETAEPIEDEQAGVDRPLPTAFLWAIYNQRTAVLTVAVDPSAEFPSEWSLRWPGERSEAAPPLADHRQRPWPPAEGRIVLQLSASLRGANIAGLRLAWRDEEGELQSATLPVHIESGDDLLPPEEFRSLTADVILECLLSGREPAEWVEALERRQERGQADGASREIDSLRAVDTSSYVLYRTRRLGAALAALGQRLLRTVRTRDATSYRLRQDPLGPRMLAQALVREWEAAAGQNRERADDPAVLLFSLAEINLMLAHVARRITEAHLRPLLRETIEEIDKQCGEAAAGLGPPPPNLRRYLMAVKGKYEHLFGDTAGGGRHAG
jgi:hypothetical protein